MRDYFIEVREICKETIVERDLSNAEKIYKSCLGSFRNIPKKEREALSEEDLKNRDETMVILNLNLAFCLLQRKEAKQALKYAEEAKILDPSSSKAFYRCYQAHRISNTLSPAKRNLHKAIELEPGNKVMRREYTKLVDEKTERENKWYQQMSGFYHKAKFEEIEEKRKAEEILKFKIGRQVFN